MGFGSAISGTLFDLEMVLRSRRGQAAMTIQEANILMEWKTQALRNFTIGFTGGSLVTFLATRRLNQIVRMSFSLGNGFICGLLGFGRSPDPFIERILSLEGSRMQRELANILLKKYNSDPSALKHLPKHFYSEEVYEDSSVDKPKFRWRIRNFYSDPVALSQNQSHSDEQSYLNKTGTWKTTVESERVKASRAADAAEHPFDFMFGLPESAENTSGISNTGSRRESRREKRSRRRRQRLERASSETPTKISTFSTPIGLN